MADDIDFDIVGALLSNQTQEVEEEEEEEIKPQTRKLRRVISSQLEEESIVEKVKEKTPAPKNIQPVKDVKPAKEVKSPLEIKKVANKF